MGGGERGRDKRCGGQESKQASDLRYVARETEAGKSEQAERTDEQPAHPYNELNLIAPDWTGSDFRRAVKH